MGSAVLGHWLVLGEWTLLSLSCSSSVFFGNQEMPCSDDNVEGLPRYSNVFVPLPGIISLFKKTHGSQRFLMSKASEMVNVHLLSHRRLEYNPQIPQWKGRGRNTWKLSSVNRISTTACMHLHTYVINIVIIEIIILEMDKVSLWTSGCPGTHEDPADFRLLEISLLLPSMFCLLFIHFKILLRWKINHFTLLLNIQNKVCTREMSQCLRSLNTLTNNLRTNPITCIPAHGHL